MSDNLVTPIGTVATKEIAGAHFQKGVLASPTGALINPASLEGQAALAAARGFVVIPGSGGAGLPTPVRGIIVTSAGNLAVAMADGSDNNASPIPVLAGQMWPLAVTQLLAANTAGVLGLS